jgi:hypothetical protein
MGIDLVNLWDIDGPWAKKAHERYQKGQEGLLPHVRSMANSKNFLNLTNLEKKADEMWEMK